MLKKLIYSLLHDLSVETYFIFCYGTLELNKTFKAIIKKDNKCMLYLVYL